MDRRFLFFDTETSGFPSGKISANDPKQAWIVQFAARLIDGHGRTLMLLNIVQKANGRSVHPKTTEIHGYTADDCDRVGIDTKDMHDMILSMFKQCDIAICHNVNFDKKMLDLLGQCFEDQTLLDNVRSTPMFCTMASTDTLCKIPYQPDKNGRTRRGFKWPKLEELYAFLFCGEEFENAHDALGDVNATVRCFSHPSVQEIFNKES